MFSSSHVLERGDIATKFTHGGLGILMRLLLESRSEGERVILE
jgi:hypothetical protein